MNKVVFLLLFLQFFIPFTKAQTINKHIKSNNFTKNK